MNTIAVSKLTETHGSKKTTVPKDVVEKFDDPEKIIWKVDEQGQIVAILE